MRIKNLSFQKASYLCKPPEHIGYQICKWEPNKYYQRESEFTKIDSNFYRDDSSPVFTYFKIHKNCFKYPETNYAIACFNYNEHEEYYELEFVGDRPMNLTKEEREIFWQLLDYGFKTLNGHEE